MSTAIKYGFVRTLPSIIRLQIGLIIYLIVVVAAGLEAILVTLERLVNAVKWLGAGYLVYLGIMT